MTAAISLAMLLDDVGRRGQVVEGGDQHVLAGGPGNAVAVRDRFRERRRLVGSAGELADVVTAVPAAFELEDLVAAGGGAGQPQGDAGRLAAGRLKAELLAARNRLDDRLRQADGRLVEREVAGAER